MIPIGGKPLLEHQIELACRHGFREILIFSFHRSEVIENYFGNGERWGARVEFLVENQPMGTAGAVLQGFDRLADEFLVLYGDTMINVDLERFWRFHSERGADATLFLHPNDHPHDSDLVEVDAGDRVLAFHNRPHPPGAFFQNLVNAGLYVLRKECLAPWRNTLGPLDFGKDLFPVMTREGRRLIGYNSPEYIKDIGTPDRYDRVCAEYASGVVERGSLAVKQRAVFLDRDGTLNEEVDGVCRPEDLRLIEGAAEAVYLLNRQGVRTVLVTNQPVVAKGFCTERDVRAVHNKLESLLGASHAFLDRIYFCPHHPEKGFPGERPELKIRCDCRKPGIGMIHQAQADLNIDLTRSWMIGDTSTDIQTARAAGLKSVLVRTGHGGRDGKFAVQPDYAFDRLGEAVGFIIGRLNQERIS
jgi:histidinol-phosphate phosphatase family protein